MTIANASPASIGALLTAAASDEKQALAKQHMPVLMLDKAEPYPPVAMGYSIFEEKGQSLSSKFQIVPQGGAVIEYAIWYDWDIQHLYDLEHIWVYLDAQGDVVRVDGSRHGQRKPMVSDGGLCAVKDGRPIVYCEAGKHAHWGSGENMRAGACCYLPAMCSDLAAWWGVHEGNRFCESGLYTPSAKDHRLAKLKTKADAFLPSFVFETAIDEKIALVPWHAMEIWIPHRVAWLMAELPLYVPHIEAVFFDCGDTIVDEATEVKEPGSEVVTEAEFFPGGPKMVRDVHNAGYRIALVVDGPRATFENTLKPEGLWDLFEAHVISEEVGELKPSPKMFATAFDAIGLDKSHAGQCVMIGNNLARDINGANNFGLQSVFLRWSDRRSHRPSDVTMIPDHSIETPTDFLPLLKSIEEKMGLEAKKVKTEQGSGQVQ